MYAKFSKIARWIFFVVPVVLALVEYTIRQVTGQSEHSSYYGLGMLVAGIGLMFGLTVPPAPLVEPCRVPTDRDIENHSRYTKRHGAELDQVANAIALACVGLLIWFFMLVAELYGPWKTWLDDNAIYGGTIPAYAGGMYYVLAAHMTNWRAKG